MKKVKEFAVHHIHVLEGGDVYTLFHKGSCIDMLDLLNQLTKIQISAENKAKRGVRE